MEKSPDAFRTISEVAAWLDTPAHVLRFWESRFPEVAPLKRAGGRRYYRPDDMRLLGGIKHLLHTEGQTIKSVQERLRREGVAPVRALSQPLEHDIDERADDLHAAAASDGAVAKGGRGDDRRAAGDGGDTAPGMEALPPIGFFFDDGADAPDADHQSGTFAPMRGVDGSASGRRDMPEPQDLNPPEPVPDTPPDEAADRPPAATPVPTAAQEAPARKPLPPLPDLPPDPAVDASGAPPVPLPLASELRTLVAASLPAEVRAALADAATRLAQLRGRSGDVAGTDRDGN